MAGGLKSGGPVRRDMPPGRGFRTIATYCKEIGLGIDGHAFFHGKLEAPEDEGRHHGPA